ncbi:MAG: D-glycero-alpha-D-manno-heptose 1-phosphate guanylyltransferase [Elusimicrobia bacterium ADurb.Bin231]|nr:MAG: D-glycero-alpha-D-manno-heptose 1-phosphate guanylyltransferase [Elusimicrobia bacterium ADurb.Bin231]
MLRIDNIKKYITAKESTLKEVVKVIDSNREGIAFVVEKNNKLIGTITDGDVRRFILKNGDINTRCNVVMNRRYLYIRKDSPEEALRLIQTNRIRHIPLVGNGRKLQKIFVSDTLYDQHNKVIAVIMAGGEGKRLRKVSRHTPKPLVKIEEKPILEDVITGLRKHNIKDIYLAIRYKANTIKSHFKKNSNLGVNIKYLEEKKKLGTAGALSLLPKDEIPDTIVVVNADVLTSTNYTSLIDFYRNHHLLLCAASKEYVFDIPYGVFDVCNGYLTGITEKPSRRFLCNAGIYVLNKEVLKLIPKHKHFNMTDLIKAATHRSLPVGVFPLYEYWIDIGNAADLYRAKSEYNVIFKRKEYE